MKVYIMGSILDKKKVDEKKYQQYASSRNSMKMITTTGRKIIFVGYKYMTCEQDIIDYLDDEISKGLNVVTKGELLTSKEADPMEALKKKHIQEYLAKEQQELTDIALGKTKDMGNTKSKEAIAGGANPTSSKGVTNAAKS